MCHKCGKKGYYRNECWSKPKVNKLQISEENKNKIFEIFKLNKIEIYNSDKEYSSKENDTSDYPSSNE